MSSNIHQDVYENNSNSSSTSEQTEVDSGDDSNQPQQHNKKKQENLSVQRSFISTLQLDGVEDLSQFDVQAYDQQTYEEGVFEQVDKALQKRAPAQTTQKPATSSNFLQFLQEKNVQIKEESTTNQSDNHDYGNEVLESTKLEAQKQNIKPESISKICELLSSDDERFEPDEDDIDLDDNESYEYETEYSDNNDGYSASKPKTRGKRKVISTKKLKLKDDGDTDYYVARMKEFAYERAKEKLDRLDDYESQYERSIKVEGALSIPENLWNSLFEHQKIGVKWFWELHQLGSGGILGDEMGLGKTIQMIAFFVALRTSGILDRHTRHEGLGPVVLVCPATVMHQWLYEFRRWYPPFRVAILHNTGSFTGKKNNLIDTIYKSKGILIVSFSGVVIYQDSLHSYKWHYAVLDEGHKIRNPDAQVTLACKRFRTPHRIILSGSPVQNNLRELWSVFDFIYPGKLGTLPVFMDQFATPITQGGYANATDTQVQVAYKCACVLRDTIKAYLLRRSKAEINSKLKLPDKSEQVLFCKLTERQRSLYSAYLKSPTIRDIKRGACQIFVGLIELRKICNHPDLFDSVDNSSLYRVKDKARVQNKIDDLNSKHDLDEDNFGDFKKSGKMLVVDVLLKLWKKQGNKVLLFSQSRQMLRIFSSYLNERQYSHLSMDGQTPIGARQALVDKFNKDLDVFVFLLTTRVGGVGVNLVGANRIIIFDPDWNPSTDIQARERAWRIGQTRDVIIYRLITAGTIEEKIYHRQVFKLYLTNRILRDTKQKRFFKTNDLHELFTLGDDGKNIETKALFEDDVQIKAKHIIKSKHKKKSKSKQKENKCIMSNKLTKVDHEFKLSDSQKQAIMEKARAISKKLSLEYNTEPKSSHQSIQQTIQPSTSTDTSSYAPIHECSKKSKSKKRHFVDHLVRQDIYKESDKKIDNEDVDEYVLKKLFKKSNIFGALKHDKIESDQTSDYKLVENEANKIAQDAIRSLKESRQYCLNSSTGVPNWTGRNGFEAPRQENRLGSRKKNRFKTQDAQVESSSLLSAIKSRTFLNPNDSVSTNDDDSNTDTGLTSEFHGIAEGTGSEIIASKLRNFMMFESPTAGESQTDELLDFFKKHFSISRTAVFKAILYKMCVFERRGSRGFWSLKSEFRI